MVASYAVTLVGARFGLPSEPLPCRLTVAGSDHAARRDRHAVHHLRRSGGVGERRYRGRIRPREGAIIDDGPHTDLAIDGNGPSVEGEESLSPERGGELVVAEIGGRIGRRAGERNAIVGACRRHVIEQETGAEPVEIRRVTVAAVELLEAVRPKCR